MPQCMCTAVKCVPINDTSIKFEDQLLLQSRNDGIEKYLVLWYHGYPKYYYDKKIECLLCTIAAYSMVLLWV